MTNINDPRDVLEPALKLAIQLGGLVQSSNMSNDRNEQAAIQESIEWVREQLREARRDVERRIDKCPNGDER